LRLVAADTGKSSSGSDQGAATEARALGDKLAVAQERLDITHRENAELQSRMGDLQDQLTKLQRLVQLKDDQLAKLQAELAQAEKAPAPVAVAQPEVATAIESTAPAVDPSEAAAPLETVGATGPETAAADAAATPPDLNYVEEAEAASAAQTAASELAHATEPWAVSAPVDAIAQGEPAQVKPEPVPAVEAQTPSSFYDRLLKDQTMLALVGGGALVVLLLLLLVISRRNARREAQLQEALANEAEPQGSFDATADDSAFEALSDIVQPVEAERQTAAQSGDPLGEAEIFIAYGRFNQAAELLEGAVNDEPARTDLRLRLMEVYAELGDRDGFIRQQAELGEIGGAAADVDQIKAKYPAMVGLGVAMAGGTAAAIEDMDDFNFDDLQFEDSLSDTSPASPVTSAQLDEDSFDLDLDDLDDLELDLGAGKAPTAQDFASTEFNHTFGEAELPASETTDLMADFSLDMDAPESVASPVEDDFLLDLDLDLDVPSVASPVIEPLSEPNEALGELDLPDDFDLSLAEEGLASEAEDSADFLAELDDVSAELQQLADGAEAFGTPLASGAEFSASLEPEVPVDDDEFDFLSGTDETATKLDLARAYVDMGDTEGARDILDEVINEGSDVQQSEARELLASLV
jgi:pilus assembly protein FimV